MERNIENINKKRYGVLAAGMIIQLCAGVIYMWSIFKKPVSEYLSWDPGAVALVSSIMLSAFVIGMLMGGHITDRHGPRNTALIGSVMMSGGIMASSLVTMSNPGMLYLTYSILGGLGVGIVYSATVSIVQKWFYDRRGFATGMMVGAYGFSLVIFAPLANYMLGEVGVPSTFALLGTSFLVICVIASSFLSVPPKGYALPNDAKNAERDAQKQYTPSEMLRTGSFYLILLSMFFVLPAYFILNPLYMTLGIERGLSESVAVMGVMITGICSASGRMFITWSSDRLGRMLSLTMIVIMTMLGILLLIVAHGYLFIMCLALIAFAFGGASGVYAAMTADRFGTQNMGTNYGLVSLGFGASALVFPMISNQLSASRDYTSSFALAAITCVIAFVLILMLRKADSKNALGVDTRS